MQTRLKAARQEQRWGQQRLITELERAARERGIRLPARASLKAQISRWENGWVRPSELYCDLLRDAYHLEDQDLGIQAHPLAANGVAPVIDRTAMLAPPLPQRVSPDMLACARDQLAALARWDNMVGPHQVLPTVVTQAVQMEQLLSQSNDALRPHTLELCVSYAEFAGWLHQDAGFTDAAVAWSDRARDYAEELGDAHLRSYVLMRKSNLALEGGDGARSLSLANSSLAASERLTPRLRALGLRQRALALATMGDKSGCETALAASAEAVQQVPVGEDHLSYCTPSYVLMESGRCWLMLDQPTKAVTTLGAAVEQWPDAFLRDRGLALARLARALLANREVDRACALALEATEVARSTASARTVAQLRLLSRRLTHYLDVPVVSDVQVELKQLCE